MVSKKVVLYVEGGGDDATLLSECRKGFNKFLTSAGCAGHMPRIVACGSRDNAFDRFNSACKLKPNECSFLLVDSEEPVKSENESGLPNEWKPWNHLKNRAGDGWTQPELSNQEQCNLMVQCMESWIACDVKTLKDFYGQGFNDKFFSAIKDVEKIGKEQIFHNLEAATKDTKTKGKYNKGQHSFKLLQLISPDVVCRKSKWAQRFIDCLKKYCGF